MKKLIFFVATAIIFSACANLSDKELDAQYLREPIFIDAKDRQGCKIAHFFNQDDDEKPLDEKIAIASNAEIVWDGACEDGYANGIGAEITQDKNGAKRVLIAVYTERIPRYVYLYQSNGNDYTLFMGAFRNIIHHLQNHNKDGLIVESDGRELQLRTLRADIVFDTNYSNNRQLSINGYELRDILLMPQWEEHKHALRLMRDYKEDLLKSIANYSESLAIAQQYKNKVCGESMGEFGGESIVDSAKDLVNVGVDLVNQNVDLDADSSVDLSAIHHREICALKISYNAEIEIMRKLIEFLSKL